jgi:hypothetical protein
MNLNEKIQRKRVDNGWMKIEELALNGPKQVVESLPMR